MFKVGDNVVCVHASSIYPFMQAGKIYTVVRVKQRALSTVQVEGSPLFWLHSRFDLAPAAITDPDVYVGQGLDVVWTDELTDLVPEAAPETDEGREQAAREKLRAYKREMRDWLYGTTSGEDK